MSALIQDKLRVMHNGSYMSASDEKYNLRTSLIYLTDIGNRAQDNVYDRGQSQYVTSVGSAPGESDFVSGHSGRRAIDLVKTNKVLISQDQGEIKKYSDLNLIRTVEIKETEVDTAYTAGTSLVVKDSTGLSSTGTVEVSNEVRRYTAVTGNTITLATAFTNAHASGSRVKFYASMQETKVSTAYTSGTTLVVESTRGVTGTSGTVYIGTESVAYSAVSGSNVTISALTNDYAVGTRVLLVV